MSGNAQTGSEYVISEIWSLNHLLMSVKDILEIWSLNHFRMSMKDIFGDLEPQINGFISKIAEIQKEYVISDISCQNQFQL